ncbi:hypothetical protein LBMAG48_19530 [Phycisphaerae bacterium]|nr:hypothetical protein LBMAG48_19530 [Phycisphaerae bacterium]
MLNFLRKSKPASNDFTCMMYDMQPSECEGLVCRQDLPGWTTMLLRKQGEVWESVQADSLTPAQIAEAWELAKAAALKASDDGEFTEFGDSGVVAYSGTHKDAAPGVLLHLRNFPELVGSVGTLVLQYDKFMVIFAIINDAAEVRESFKLLLKGFAAVASDDGAEGDAHPANGWWFDSEGFEQWTMSEDRKISPGPRLKAVLKSKS